MIRTKQRSYELVRVHHYGMRPVMGAPNDTSEFHSMVFMVAKLLAIKDVVGWDDEGGILELEDAADANAIQMDAVEFILDMKEAQL